MRTRAWMGASTLLIVAMLISPSAHAQSAPPPSQQPLAPPPPAQAPPPVMTQPQPVYVQPYHAQPVAPPPVLQPQERTRPILGLAISGGVLLGVSWLIHALLVSPFAGCDIDGDCQDAWRDFRFTGLIPLAGPFVQLAVRPTTGGDIWDQYLVIDGVLQIAGLAMLVLGLSIQTTETVYASGEGGFQLTFAPMVSRDASGITAMGRF